MQNKSLVLVVVLGLVGLVFGQCGSFTFGDDTYNLNGLTSSQGYVFALNYYTYTVNFCAPVQDGTNVAATQNSEWGLVPIGRLPATVTPVSSNSTGLKGVTITYVNDQDFQCKNGVNRKTIINVFCSPSSTTPQFINVEEGDVCTYIVEMYAAAACPVKPTTNCGIFNDDAGNSYDLTSLTSATDYTGVSGAYTYYWNFCTDVTIPNCKQPTTVCQKANSGNPDYIYSLGALPATIAAGANGKTGVTVTYTNPQRNCVGGKHPVTQIFVACDQKATTPVVNEVAELGACQYDISMSAAAACPVSSPNNQTNCCLYELSNAQKSLCTTDATCPTLAGYQFLGSWHVQDCAACQSPHNKKININKINKN